MTYDDIERHSKLLNEQYTENYKSNVGAMVIDEYFNNEINFYNDDAPFYDDPTTEKGKQSTIFQIIPVVFIKNTLAIGDWYLIKNKPFVVVENNKLIGLVKIGSFAVYDNKSELWTARFDFINKCLSEFFKQYIEFIK